MDDEGRPVAYTALPRGILVTTLSGQAIGKLERILDDNGDIFHGIVVSTGTGPKFVARNMIERMTTTHIRCFLTDEQARDLPPAPTGRRPKAKPWFARRTP